MVNYRPAYFSVGIGKRVRDLRERRGLTQNALAEAARVPQPTLNRIENNPKKDPALSIAVKIARALDVPVESLFEEEQRPTRVGIITDGGLEFAPEQASQMDSVRAQASRLDDIEADVEAVHQMTDLQGAAMREMLDALLTLETVPAPVRAKLQRALTNLGSGAPA